MAYRKTRKSGERSPQEWWEEIERGLDYRDTYGLERHWPELERMFYHVHESMITAGPNIIASTGDSMLSHLLVPRAKYIVSPTRSDRVMQSRVLQQVDNSLVNRMRMRNPMARGCLAAYTWGVGILKVGYDSEFGWAPSLDVGGASRMGMTITQLNRKGQRIEFNNVRPGMPWVNDVLPHDFVVPWGTRDLDDAWFAAHRIVRHIDEVKSDPKYENTEDLQPGLSMSDFVESYESGIRPRRMSYYEMEVTPSDRPSDDAEYVTLWEISDRRTGRRYVIAEGYNEFLFNEPDGLQINGKLPYVAIRFTPHARNFWVTPDAYYLKPAQAEATDISIQACVQRRLGSLRFAYEDGAISPGELAKALSGQPGVGFKVRAGKNPANAIFPFQPGNNQSLYMEQEYNRRNAREIVGLGQNQNGEFDGSSRRSATEAANVAAGSQTRMSRRGSELAAAHVDTIEIVNGIIFENWTTYQEVQVLDPYGRMIWQQYTGPHLAGEYDYEVQFSSEGNPTIEQRRQEAMAQYQMWTGKTDEMALRQFLTGRYADVDFSSIFSGVPSGQPSFAGQQQRPGLPGGLPVQRMRRNASVGAGGAGRVANGAGGPAAAPAA